MTREEYLNTTGGQVHHRYKRLFKLVRFTVYQEPKGKIVPMKKNANFVSRFMFSLENKIEGDLEGIYYCK